MPQNNKGSVASANTERLAMVGDSMDRRLVRIKGVRALHGEVPLPNRKSYWALLRCSMVTKLLSPRTSIVAECPKSTVITGINHLAVMASTGSTATSSHKPTTIAPTNTPALAGHR